MTNYTVHATTLVDNGAVIGEDSRVWHWVHVCGGAKIGRGCSLGQSVSVGNPVTFRDNVKIQNNVSVYDDFTLEDGVFCGPRMVFTNICNPRSEVSRKDEYRNTLVKRGATLGANSTIVCGITIGEYATVGAGAMVDRDVPAFALMLGIPARLAGWMSRFGERLNLPLDGDAETECPNTGERYTLHDNVCTLVPVD